MGFPSGSVVKNLPTNAVDTGDEGSILELGRSPEAGNSLQYSWQENPMDRGAWWVTVHRVAKSQTRLSTHTYFSLWVFSHVPSSFFCYTTLFSAITIMKNLIISFAMFAYLKTVSLTCFVGNIQIRKLAWLLVQELATSMCQLFESKDCQLSLNIYRILS